MESTLVEPASENLSPSCKISLGFMIESLFFLPPFQENRERVQVKAKFELKIKKDISGALARCFADEVLVDVDSDLLLRSCGD